MRSFSFISFAAITMLTLAASARAGETFSFNINPPQPPHFVSFADDHRWTFEVLGTFLGDVTNRHVVMGGATTGIGYYVLDNLAVMLDVSGYGFNEGHESGEAAGVTLGLRHHLLNLGKSALFMDVSGGIIGATQEIPHRGTHFNDTFEVGPGIAYPLQDHLYLLGGVRYFHLSNANRTGEPGRNPSVNAIQGVFGLMWRF